MPVSTQSPENYQIGQVEYTVFSTTGKGVSPEAYDKAMADFVTTKKVPEGFSVLPAAGLQAKARGVFDEWVSGPIQRGNEKVQAALAATPEGGAAPPAYQHILEAAKGAGRYLAGTGAESMSTPGKALATAATTLMPPSRVAGVVLAAAKRGIAAGGAQAIGDVVTGQQPFTGPGISKAVNEGLMTAVVVGLSQGAAGALKHITGQSLSKQGVKGVASDITDLLKRDYPQLSRLGQDSAVNHIASTPEGLKKLAHIGAKAVVGDAKLMANEFVGEVNNALPRSMGKVAARHMNDKLVKYVEKSEKWLDAFGDDKLKGKLEGEMHELMGDIAKIVDAEFTASPLNKKGMEAVAGVMQKYMQKKEALQGYGEVIHALRESGAQEGFNPMAFQKQIMNKVYNRSNLQQDLSTAAGRGVLGGVDKPTRTGIPASITVPFTGLKVPLSVETGTKLVGRVPGRGSEVIVSQEALRQYFKED